MVRIQKLVLKNFKSFRKAEVPFSQGFTVIVGSNGSGKSNVLDAMLFAMGSTSLKILRASRLTDLVYNNATENYAKVELHLRHGAQSYEITRMIDKQGRSVYRLNGNRVTLNEVSSLLAELGLRPDGHNIVMQGDVTRVIEMSPEERRQIIDELAGLREFDEKREEAMRNLEKVEAKIRETMIVLQERESYLRELEKEREAALRFDSLEREKKRLNATLLSLEMRRVRSALEDCGVRIKENAVKREGLEAELAGLEERVGEQRRRLRELNESLLTASQRIFRAIGARLEEKRSELVLNSELIKRKREIIARNESKISALRERQAGLSDERKRLEAEKAGIESELPFVEERIGALQRRRDRLSGVHGRKHSKILEIEAKIKQLSKRVELVKRDELSKWAEAESVKRRQAAESEALRELLREKEIVEEAVTELERKQGLLESIYGKEKRPAAALEACKRRLDDVLVKCREKRALVGSLEEKALMLQKRLAACPVCESPLEEGKRKRLLSDTLNAVRSNSSELLALEREEKSLRDKARLLEELVLRERELSLALKQLPIERAKNKALSEKISSLRERLSNKALSVVEAKARKAREQWKALSSELEGLEAERNDLVGGLGLDELNKLNSLLGEAVTRKGLLRQRIEQIDGELNQRIARENALVLDEIRVLEAENSSLEAEVEQCLEKSSSLEREKRELEAKFAEAERKNRGKVVERDELERALEETSERLSVVQQKIRAIEQTENQLKVEASGFKVRLADLQEEFKGFEGEGVLEGLGEEEARQRLESVHRQISELGAINMKAIESFEELAAEVKDVRAKVERLEKERLAVLGLIEKIEVKRTNVFMDCFQGVSRHFSEAFFELFEGEGLLSLSNPDNPLESGLIIEAKHKGNSLKNIDSMSGGEKALTALAFLFAIQLYEPAPFYVFDEADAALDKENSLKMVRMIKRISKRRQFIAITHNDPLIKEADQIIGVALDRQKSSVIGLRLRESVARA